jgi:aryl-alcohol dehydrogenase-like predicted oxidoreductase
MKILDTATKIQANMTGNNAKSLKVSVEASLKKLRTSYIDILYVHFWDFRTSIPEVMDNLNNLVVSGKVLYLGISDAPAWVVSAANEYAKAHAKAQFVIYQGLWNVLDRSFERDIIPMARQYGLALAPWGVLASGKIRTDEEEERRKQSKENGRTGFEGADPESWVRNEEERAMTKVLERVGKELGTKSISAVAIAYLMHKTTYVFPIIGGRKVEHLMENVEALDLHLTPDHIKAIEDAKAFDLGFPTRLIVSYNIFFRGMRSQLKRAFPFRVMVPFKHRGT